MILFTHPFDLISKLLSIVAFGTIGFAAGLFDGIASFAVQTPSPTLTEFASTLGFWIVYQAAVHRRTIDVVSTMLFVRVKFGIWSTWRQAYQLRRLFSPGPLGFSGKWYPMDDVVGLEKNERLTVLLKFSLQLKVNPND